MCRPSRLASGITRPVGAVSAASIVALHGVDRLEAGATLRSQVRKTWAGRRNRARGQPGADQLAALDLEAPISGWHQRDAETSAARGYGRTLAVEPVGDAQRLQTLCCFQPIGASPVIR
jgi:hypothetical protein